MVNPSPIVDTHTVTCPFPECTWREVVEIRAEYPPSLVQMFIDLAAQHREHHLGEHSGLDWAAAYAAAQQPRRGDAVDGWLKSERDEYVPDGPTWVALDNLLDAYRLHADTGTPLGEHVCEQHCDCHEAAVPLGRDVSDGGQW
ncbi:hypothetical protein [Streptacidiphilus cavernicola]|uniref:Uncharacterized protein n=1 Tax=Streptacidiphilus cavernicola TaxID=3342716 RepID=A0ABV6VXW6_9ACTN